MSFAIDDDVPQPEPAKRGRKNAPVPSKAADAVRDGECGIKEAAHRFFDEHIGFATTETERADEQLYAERFRDFVLMIAADLKRNPRWFSTYRKLGVLHAEKMKNSAYRRSHETKFDYVERIRQELRSIGVID
jgi:hypothetical protein